MQDEYKTTVVGSGNEEKTADDSRTWYVVITIFPRFCMCNILVVENILTSSYRKFTV